MSNRIKPFLDAITARAKSNFHRYTIIISGEPSWCLSLAEETESHLGYPETLWVTKQAITKHNLFNSSRAQHFLGMEFQAVFFDVYSGFDPDIFAAIAGTIAGGGVLVILSPPLESWRQFEDPEKSRIAIWPYKASDISGRFLELVAQQLQIDASVLIVQQGQPLPDINKLAINTISKTPKRTYEPTLEYCRTEDQKRAVEAIMHVVSGHRHRPLVITSDRGRGKSSALGIAAAVLFNQGITRIVVTAPRLAAVTSVFEIAKKCLAMPEVVQLLKSTKGKLQLKNASLEFVPPDELIRQQRDCSLLLVDEAAAIPTKVLESLLKQYSRVVFATTVHGYEGTGRGFVLRFQSKLDRLTPQWQAVELKTPIRWAEGDPLERLIFRALLLNADAAADEVVRLASVTECCFERIDRDSLLEDKETLEQIFGLLVLAHYQTQPADLRYLLDAKHIKIYVLKYKNNVVAAALLEDEGHIDPDLSEKLYANRRRVRGHLMAQTMAVYVGIPSSPRLKYARVMRIAVHPLAQRKGIGGHFLQQIERDIHREQYDIWGASFGATPGLIRFWCNAGFSPVHLGLKRNTSSGLHAALVLRPMSEQGTEVYQRAREKFRKHFPVLLGDVYRDLEADLVQALSVTDNSVIDYQISKDDLQDIASYATSARGYEVNAVPLWKLVCYCFCNQLGIDGLTEKEMNILVAKVLQKLTWPEVVRLCKLSGVKEAQSLLRNVLSKLFECYTQSKVTMGLGENKA